MPFQAPSWTQFYACPICCNDFSFAQRLPISLGCGHTICRLCLATVYNSQCPFDQTIITTDFDNLPINTALLQLFDINNEDLDAKLEKKKQDNVSCTDNASLTKSPSIVTNGNKNGSLNNSDAHLNSQSLEIHQMPLSVRKLSADDLKCYKTSKRCIEELAQYLKSFFHNSGNLLTRPMLRKLVTLANCQLMEEEGRIRAIRTARLLGERTVTELLLQHQNPQQLSLYLWAAVRSRGCQFLGPVMQEEVLKLVLKALENGSALSRKVLVMYVVQRLVENFLPASKTSIGHVVQLLYRASCFKVSKREGDSSLMQLKEEFRNYEALRREHDAQIVQIATEAGLRIAPDQWSSLLYGNMAHKSHMQSICDSLQSPSSFSQSVQELVLALQRTGDPTNLFTLRPHLKHLASIDLSLESLPPMWRDVENALAAVRHVVLGLVKFLQFHNNQNAQDYTSTTIHNNGRYKISLCRDLAKKRLCPRGENCTFAHSTEERQRYRAKNRRPGLNKVALRNTISGNCNRAIHETTEKDCYKNTSAKIVSNNSLQQSKTILDHHDVRNRNVTQKSSLPRLHALSNASATSPVKGKKSPKSPIHKATESLNNKFVDNSIVPAESGDLCLNLPFYKAERFYSAMYDDRFVSTMPHHFAHEFDLSSQTRPLDDFQESNFAAFNANCYNSRRSVIIPSVYTSNVLSSTTAENLCMNGKTTILNTQQLRITTAVNPPNSFNTPKIGSHSPISSSYSNTKEISIINNCMTNYFYEKGIEQTKKIRDNSLSNELSPSYNSAPFNVNCAFGSIDIEPKSSEFSFGFSPKSNMLNEIPSNSLSWDAKSCRLPTAVTDLLPPNHPIFTTEPSTLLLDENMNLETNTMQQLSDKNIMKNESLTNNNTLVLPDDQISVWNSENKVNMTVTGADSSSTNLSDIAMNIQTPRTSLFYDREAFVRSDSILDDDASTFDVPTVVTTLGSKYGPICPMHKGLTSSASKVKSVDYKYNSQQPLGDHTWNDNNNYSVKNPIASNNTNISVFSPDSVKDNNSPPKPIFYNRTAVEAFESLKNASRNDLQTIHPTLCSLNFNNATATNVNTPSPVIKQISTATNNTNSCKFDLSPLVNALGSTPFTSDESKKSFSDDDLIDRNTTCNYSGQQQQRNFNNYWHDNLPFAINPTNCTLELMTQSTQNRQKEGTDHQLEKYANIHQHQCIYNKNKIEKGAVDENNELNVKDIVHNIWPRIDNNDHENWIRNLNNI